MELRYLIYVAILMGLLWIPYILAHIAQVGPLKALGYPDTVEMPEWAARLKRAHYNTVENIPLFAVAVLAGEIRNVHTATTLACATIFFWARAAYPVAAVANIWGTRTGTFAVAWAAVMVYLFTVLTA
jgi:uncharacterized MAPEG superfamily protein